MTGDIAQTATHRAPFAIELKMQSATANLLIGSLHWRIGQSEYIGPDIERNVQDARLKPADYVDFAADLLRYSGIEP